MPRLLSDDGSSLAVNDEEEDDEPLAMKHFTRTIGASPDAKTAFADP